MLLAIQNGGGRGDLALAAVFGPLSLAWVAGLAVVAMILCGVMLWRGGRDVGMPGCGPRSGCDAVTRSRWARLGPVPVAGFGMVLYGVLAGAAGFGCLGAPVEGVVTVAAVMAGGAAVWFVGLQLMVLRQVCLYCMMLQGLGLVIAGLILTQVVPVGWVAVGAVGIVGFVGGQILLRPRTYRIRQVETLPEEPVSAHPSQSGVGTTTSTVLPAVAERTTAAVRTTVRLAAGRAILNLADWPMLGPANARQIVGLLFDPICPTCWEVYGVLQKAVGERPGELAVLMVPVPLDSGCNPGVKVTAAGHEGACEYVRLVLAMWWAKPEAWEELARWGQGRCAAGRLAALAVPALRRLDRPPIGGDNSIATLTPDTSIETRHVSSQALQRRKP